MPDNSIKKFINSEIWKVYQKEIQAKKKFCKSGPDVIHLEYLEPMFSDGELKEFEDKVSAVGLRLGWFDKNGVMYASLDTFELVTYVAIAQPIIRELIKGVGTNAVWEVIKFLLQSSWKKAKDNFYTRSTSQREQMRKITFGLKVQIDQNTSFNFDLKGDFDESVIQSSLDKILNFLREQRPNDTYKHTDYVYYDKSSGKWVKIDVEKELRKMIKKGQKKN